MNDTDLAWAAGLIDGEGCIYIHYTDLRKNQKPGFSLTLKVSMTHGETILRLRDLFGVGSIQLFVPENKRHRRSYSWVCKARATAGVLALVRPYMFTKAQEADIALEYARLPPVRAKSKELDYAERERLYWLLRRSKSRWEETDYRHE